MKNPLHIEICGGIGVGKSTLAQRLSALLPNSAVIFEGFESNALWRKYYEAPEKYVKEKNISFLAQHFAELKYASASILIADFSPIQDLAYAMLVGDSEHYEVMSKIYNHLRTPISKERLVLLHLITSLDRQNSQVKRRARKEEESLTPNTLANLNFALRNVLKTQASKVSILEIDTSTIDLRTDQNVLIDIKRKILTNH